MTTAAPSRAIMLFGTEEPVPETPTLRAGPLAASLDAGNLRHVSLHGREAVRAISFIVRDRDWGTYNPEITGLDVRQDADGFLVTYEALCRDEAQSFRYRARIEGRADGRLVFAAEGLALTDFTTNRTGFVVLHGVEGVAGEPVEVERVDGSVEQARFPVLVDPVQPFKDIRALTHDVLPGLRVACRMEGDTYEMEDQRNWSDASYKTYVRPLALPWPYTLTKGERVDQRVTLEILGGPSPPPAAAGSPSPRGGADDEEPVVTVRLGGVLPQAVPSVGLEVPLAHAEDALAASDLIAAADFPHFVASLIRGVTEADVDASIRRMEAYAELLDRCGTPVSLLEAVVPCRDADGRPTADLRVMRRDLERLAAVMRRSGAQFDYVAVSPASDLKCTLPGSVWPAAPAAEELYAAARDLFPGVRIGGGMFSYFTELNRKRPPTAALDFVCHTTCPIVHAGDDLSVTESLESLPSIFRSVRAFAGGRRYWLFPTAVAMRQNPYGLNPAENAGNRRTAMGRTDPRERGLLGAAWYAGYLARAAYAGLAGVTLAAAAGPSGVVHTPQPHPQPWFDDTPAAVVLPSYHVLRGHAALAGQSLVAAETSAPRDVQALAVAVPSGIRVWLSNLTGRRRRVRVEGAATRSAEIRPIDTTTFERLCRAPDGFDLLAGPVPAGGIVLGAYAVARLDLPA